MNTKYMNRSEHTEENIELELIPREGLFVYPKAVNVSGHLFCLIPLGGYTFCDYCSNPIWNSDSRFFCMKCADCHMTCHCSCVNNVRLYCEVEKPNSESPALLPSDSCDFPTMVSAKGEKHLNDSTDNPGFLVKDETEGQLESPVDENQVYHSLLSTSEIPKNYFVTATSYRLEHSISNNDIHSSVPSDKNPDDVQTNDVRSHPVTRSVTDVHKLRKNRLSTRNSFLIGRDKSASIYSRLSYDFSSLDKEAIKSEGIRVREFSPLASEVQTNNTTRPLPTTFSSDTYLQTNGIDCNSLHDNISQNVSELHVNDLQLPDVGMASVMQTTLAFVSGDSNRSISQIPICHNNSVPFVPTTVGPRDSLPWPPEQLEHMIDIFNDNDFGLRAHKFNDPNSTDCAGQIRIHINLIRPIQMVLKPRPMSIFDIVCSQNPNDNNDDEDEDELHKDYGMRTRSKVNNAWHIDDHLTEFHFPKSVLAACENDKHPNHIHEAINQLNQNSRCPAKCDTVTTFRIPRGSTNLISLCLSTTVQTVISTFLDRFGIKDNPKKFALYEHTIEGDQEVSVRKLFDNESPLGLHFKWIELNPQQFAHTLGVKRLVLQENATDDIEWSTFSLSELYIFLGILNREEATYRRQIEMKYDLRHKEINRLLKLHEQKMQDDTQPVCKTPNLHNESDVTTPTVCEDVLEPSHNDNTHNINNTPVQSAHQGHQVITDQVDHQSSTLISTRLSPLLPRKDLRTIVDTNEQSTSPSSSPDTTLNRNNANKLNRLTSVSTSHLPDAVETSPNYDSTKKPHKINYSKIKNTTTDEDNNEHYNTHTQQGLHKYGLISFFSRFRSKKNEFKLPKPEKDQAKHRLNKTNR